MNAKVHLDVEEFAGLILCSEGRTAIDGVRPSRRVIIARVGAQLHLLSQSLQKDPVLTGLHATNSIVGYNLGTCFPLLFTPADLALCVERKRIFAVPDNSELTAISTDELLRFFGAYEGEVRRFLRSKTRRDHDVDDLVQSVWLRIQKHVESKIAEKGGVELNRSWLYTVANNIFRDEYRRTAKRKETSLETVGTSEKPFDPESNDPEPSRGVQHSELQIAIRDCLRHLSSSQQQAITLLFLQGLEYKQIQAALNKTYQACVKLVHDGKKNMEPCLRGKGVLAS